MDPRPITLLGEHVMLVPLAREHAEGLFAAAQDDAVWRWMPNPRPRELGAMRAWIDDALRAAESGDAVPFALVERASGALAGSTRYFDVRRAHRGLEIGWTWVGTPWQRTALNTEAKLLLLAHAFETLGAMRVQLKTDLRNERSQRAIERVGAVREGVLRAHMLCWDGSVRDTVMYSIVDREWPAAKERLLRRLARAP